MNSNSKTAPLASCALRVDAGAYGCGASKSRGCVAFNTSALLLARPGLMRATRALGALLRQVHGTVRRRSAGVTQLSYWNDNQAGYRCVWSAADNGLGRE